MESKSPSASMAGSEIQAPADKKLSPSTQLYRLATNVDRLAFMGGIVCSIGSGTIMPLMTLIFGNFVTVFNGFAVGTISKSDFLSQLSHYTLYFIYLFIAKIGLSYISMVLFTIVSANITSAMQQEYLHAVLHKSIAFHETKLQSGKVNEALSSHSNAIRSGLADKFGMATQHASTVVTGFIVAVTSIWNLALAVAAVIPLAVVAIGLISVFDEKMEKQIREQNLEASTLAHEVMGSIRTVRSLGKGAWEKLSDKYGMYLNKAQSIGWKRAPIYGIQVGTYMFLLYCAYALAFWYGIHLFASGRVDKSGKVITTLFSILIGMNSFSGLAGTLGSFMSIFSAAADIFDIVHDQNSNDGHNFGSSQSDISFPVDLFSQDICFDNVSFRYPTRPSVKVVESLSLTISGQQQTAFVGQSGCGKSTIVGLLLKWYDVEAGSITIGDVDIHDIPAHLLRSHIGFVSQEPQLFSGSIYDNVANGLVGSASQNLSVAEKRELVTKSCKMSYAHNFISQLPDGYDTHVGDRGTQLSGGQKQRIAIARALVKDPPIIIFDEATSALDNSSESLIQKAIEAASHGRTIISIAHRLQTIQKSDRIYVLGKQVVLEQGSHEALLESVDGVYKKLWAAQSLASRNTEREHNDAIHGPSESVESYTQHHDEKEHSSEDLGDEVKVRSKDNNLGTIATLMSVLSRYKSSWLAYVGLFLGSIIAGGLYPVQAVLYAKVVNTFQLQGSHLVSTGNFWSLMWFILAIAVAIGYMSLAGLGMGLGEMASQDYRAIYFKAFCHQPIPFFDQQSNSPGILTAKLSTDPDSIHSFAGGNLSVLITVGVALVSTIALSLAIGWKLGLVVLAGGLPFIFAASYVREHMEQTFEENAAKVFNDCVGYATECIQGIRTVVSLNMEGDVERRFGGLLSAHAVRARKYALRAMVWFALSESIELLAMALAFWYGGTLLANGEYTTEQFFIVFVALVFGSQSAGSYFAHSSDISKGAAAVNAIMQMEKSAVFPPTTQSAAEHQITENGEEKDVPLFEFRNVDFAYPARPDKPVLTNLNISMQPGQFVAIVGESGSGKSTVAGLLEGFYNVNKGAVYVHGSKVQDISGDQLHQIFSMVSQEPVLYQGTVLENLTLGTNQEVTQEDLDHVLSACQLTDLITSLPEGLSTTVGSRGAALSGGQRQRIAIARALLRDSPVLLLDEATSALDSLSESLIHEALMAGRDNQRPGADSAEEGSERRCGTGGMLVIAHRLSTVKAADVIYVMGEGRVLEAGSHDELMSRRGKYFAMWGAVQGENAS